MKKTQALDQIFILVGVIRVQFKCFSANRVRWLKLSEVLGKCVRNAKIPGDNQYMWFFFVPRAKNNI